MSYYPRMTAPKKQIPIKNEQRDPKALNPAAYNPRRISEQEKMKLRRSLREFGQVIPIVINPKGGIIGGHQTTEAAIAEGLALVDCRVVDLKSEQKEKLLNLALNRIKGEFDELLLGRLITELAKKDEVDLLLSGFDSQEVDALIEAGKKVLEGDNDEDDEFNAQEEYDKIKNPKTHPGDVIQLGDHLLICGDSVDPNTYRTLLKQEQVDMIFTDPPYNVAYKSHSKKLKGERNDTIENDAMSRDNFTTFCDGFMKCFDSWLKPGGVFYICTGWSSHPDFINAIRKIDPEWNVSGAMIWDKRQFTMGWQDYRYQYEMIVYGFKTGAAHYFIDDRKQSDIWGNIPARESLEPPEWAKAGKRMTGKLGDLPFVAFMEDENQITIELAGRTYKAVHEEEKTDLWKIKRLAHVHMVHPTEKPVVLSKRAILNSSKRGDVVLDAFGGSGSTLMACEATGRKARIIELDPKFCDVIRKRWEHYLKSDDKENE